jgi:hypothetical protein
VRSAFYVLLLAKYSFSVVLPLIDPEIVADPLDVATVQSPVIADGVPRYELTTTISDVTFTSLTVVGRDETVPQSTTSAPACAKNVFASRICPSFVDRLTMTNESVDVGVVI